jgi:thiamine-phosphate pyrophosphorylase
VDLLHGLLQEAEGRAAVLLASAGTDVAALREMFAMERLSAPDSDTNLPLSEASSRICSFAAELAAQWTTEHTIASDSLLVALLRHDDRLRRQAETHGLDFAALENQASPPGTGPIELDQPVALAEPTERIDLARILDASANRAREALRVIEDYCRFALDDAFLSREAKELRHGLAEALAYLPVHHLLEARETQRDVGTRMSTESEQSRHSLLAVVQANMKRLQEALRSLEEHGKILDPRLGRSLEQLRYHTYTLEKAVLLGTTARERLADAKLYVLLTGALCARSLDWTIQEATAGGASIFQLREKQMDDRALLERARAVRRWTRAAGALLIVNDRPDIARLVEADGVHLGQEDMPVHDARRIVGPEALIGVSTHNLDQLRQAIRDGASYVGVGPTFPSGTKQFDELAGLDFVRQANAETTLPAFVLGGVNLQTITAAVQAGARRVAVSQAICQADDPRAAAAALMNALGRAGESGQPNTHSLRSTHA